MSPQLERIGRALLGYPTRPDRSTRLVPAEAAQAVLDALPTVEPAPDPGEAHALAIRLAGCYPARQFVDPGAYATAVAALFARHPRSIAARLADPLRGLPAAHSFAPALAEIKAALEEETMRRRTILANARWTLAEHARRSTAKGAGS